MRWPRKNTMDLAQEPCQSFVPEDRRDSGAIYEFPVLSQRITAVRKRPPDGKSDRRSHRIGRFND